MLKRYVTSLHAGSIQYLCEVIVRYLSRIWHNGLASCAGVRLLL